METNVLTRRRLLEFATASYTGSLGLNLGGLWQAQAAVPQTGSSKSRPGATPTPVRSCILIFYYGGPSHLETFDLKPHAPVEVRGEFQPIATSAPGVWISEHLPNLARWMHKIALVRSVTHGARLHDSASIHALTGRPLDGVDRELFAPLPQFYPSFGGAVAHARRGLHEDIPFAALPFTFRNVVDTPCQGGGFLGAMYDPLRIESIPQELGYKVEVLRPEPDLDSTRRRERQKLLSQLQAGQPHPLNALYERAYRLLDSESLRVAVDLSREPAPTRARYGFDGPPAAVGAGGGGGNGAEMGLGRQMRGQNLLLARRLVEAGVSFVNVYDFKQQGQNWDAHFQCMRQHKEHLLPQADRALAALIEDLHERGLLDSTLVVAMGEFGRTPRLNRDGGRDHWPDCYSVLFAGGGVTGGAVHGASDSLGAYPARDPVTPADLAATIFWRFGIDPASEIHDHLGRPHRLALGEPLRQLFNA